MPSRIDRMPEQWPPLAGDEYEVDPPYVVEVNPTEPFHIGQGYSNKPAPNIACRCGNNQFSVGSGEYFTAIRCDKCGWERCIHNG